MTGIGRADFGADRCYVKDLDLDLDIFQNQNKVHTTKQIDLYKDISTIDHS